MTTMTAGKLDRPVGVLELRRDEAGNYAWAEVRRTWAGAELTHRTSLFSWAGTGAGEAVLTVRRQPLTLHNALHLGDDHLFLTSIESKARGWLEVRAAVCRSVQATAMPQAGTGRDALNRPVAEPRPAFSFPAVATQLYVREGREELFRRQTRQLVLVTSKPIRLRAGDLVRLGEEPPYTVWKTLDLDSHKNEYVVERQEDV